MRKNTKKAITAGAILLTLLASLIGASIGYTSLNVGKEAWEIQVGVTGAQVGNFEYMTPAIINTANLPTQVKQASGSFLSIDPDRTAATDAVYKKAIDLHYNYQKQGDGALPTVIFDLSQLYHCDKDGVATSSAIPSATYSENGLDWEQHFYQFSAQMKTDMGWSDSLVDAYYINEQQTTYEGQPVTVTMYVLINLNSQFTNESYKSQFADAKVVYVKSGVADPQFATWVPVGPDDPAAATPLLDVNAKIDPYTITGTDSDKTFILALQATLDGGIDYGLGVLGDIDTINAKIDVFVKYSVRFSVLVSRPPVIGEREANTIADPNYWNTWGSSIWEDFWNKSSGLLYLVVVAVAVFIGLYLVVRLRHKTMILKKA